MTELKIEYLPVTALKPYERNAKKHPPEQIAQIVRSIQDTGMNDPIGIWSEKNIIVEGHGRWMACKQLGMVTVPVIRLDHMTDEQRREYAIIHNQTTMNSGWDFDILNPELLDLFAGSGTTIMAAEQNGRTAFCMEYDPRFVDVIIDRWEKFTGRKAVRVNG